MLFKYRTRILFLLLLAGGLFAFFITSAQNLNFNVEERNDSIRKAKEKVKREQREKEEREDPDAIKITFDEPWKYFIGDDSVFAKKSFDDSKWNELEKGSELEIDEDSVLSGYYGIVWFRTTVIADTSAIERPLAIYLRQAGSAAELYFDGKMVEHYGKVGKDLASEEAVMTISPKPKALVLSREGKHVIAIRYSSFHIQQQSEKERKKNDSRGFEIDFADLNDEMEDLIDKRAIVPLVFLFTVFITLGVVHLIMFFYFRSDKQNLFFSLYCIGITFLIFFAYYSMYESNYQIHSLLSRTMIYLAPLMVVPLVAFYHTIYYQRLLRIFWIIVGIYAFAVIAHLLEWPVDKPLVAIIFLISTVEILRSHIRSVIKGRDGALILGLGIFYLPISVIILVAIAITMQAVNDDVNMDLGETGAKFLGYSLALSIPFSITLYLARNFARVNRKLVEQVDEIKQLSEKTLQQELEKQKLLEEQNLVLETRVMERTQELEGKNTLISQKNKEITDNLTYAKRIQAALLPEISQMKTAFPECFVLYLPKDIVSGDFYAFFGKEDQVLLAAADCTGHGVSGAFMSMIGSSLLSQIINTKNVTKPSVILDQLSEEIIVSLNQRSGESNDGMDMALCSFSPNLLQMEYAGANRPLWLIRNNELVVYSPDKSPIGGMQVLREQRFTNHVIDLQPGDCIYLFSDGFADQFGGDQGKKLMTRRLKELLLDACTMPMAEQENFLFTFISEWKGRNEQLDDILVIGIKV